ncbi:DUF3800 domain-containing protein [Glaciihabitans sp. dw_435]|uniref:DUF3800 domain-containing protein n=1 Tax=Glaciihabitans sp. dw_435 TaxID=2720081 RepID=UPI001BD29884|nr:DUF3800 domain-containing protein [Glaciihabitans sp. dw_435]
MLLCFVDESFKDDFYGFAGVIADEYATKDLTQRINSVMRQVSVDWGIPDSTEVHGYPLFHGKEAWQPIGARARVGIFEKLVNAIVESDVQLLLRSIHKERLARRQASESYPVNFPPEQVCFQHILQRVDRVARARDTHALVIADERGDRERHRERFAMYQTVGTPGVYMQTRLDRLLDTVHFAPSHHSRMLQAADMLAFIYRRVSTVHESDPRSHIVMQRIWSAITDSGKVSDVGQWP